MTKNRNEMTAASTIIRSTKRNRSLKISEHAIGPAVWIFFLLWIAVGGIAEFVSFVVVPAWKGREVITTIGPYTLFWFIIVGAAGVSAFITWMDFRLRIFPDIYAELVYPYIFEAEKPAPPPPAPDPQRDIPVNVGKDFHAAKVTVYRRTKTLKSGSLRFAFSGANVEEMLSRVRAGDMSIRKETSSAGKGFDSLPDSITSSRYTDARRVLLENEMINDKGEWTPKGILWLTKY